MPTSVPFSKAESQVDRQTKRLGRTPLQTRTGCEECLDVCVYGGIEMVDGKAVVNDENCFGCGRWERVCPTGAISITMEEDSVERMIARIESHVDVT